MARLTGERPMEGATPDSLLAFHAAGYREMRERLGESSYDALELALYSPAILYADDLGLRRLADGLNAKSFPTPAFLQVAAEHGWMALGGHPKPAINGQLKTGHFE